MRVLFCDKNDNLAVCKVLSLSYNKDKKQMRLLAQSSERELLFSNITPSVFRYYVKKLYLEGFVNLSCYKVYEEKE